MALSYVQGTVPDSGFANVITATGNSTDRLRAQFQYTISPNSDNTAYNISVQTRFRTEFQFMWYTGASTLKVYVEWHYSDGNVGKYFKQQDVSTPVDFEAGGGTSIWSDPVEFSGISAIGITSICIKIVLDFYRTRCSTCYNQGKPLEQCGHGPGVYSKVWPYQEPGFNHDHYRYFEADKTVDVSSIPLLQPPQISNLVNTLPYNNQQGVSSRTDYIGLSWTHSGGGNIDYAEWSNNNGVTWNRTSGITSMSWSNLAAGSSWSLSIRARNSAGTSNVLKINIRTRYAPPVIKLQLVSTDLETLTFKWTSDRPLAESQYKIDSGSWIVLNQTDTEGTFTAKWFDPNSKHTITFWGRSTSTYDSLEAYAPAVDGTTRDRSHITYIGDTIFGLSIDVKITQDADKKHKLKIWAVGSTRSSSTFEFDSLEDGIYTYNPTQDQLDDMYKCFTNTNSITIYFLLITHGDNKDWEDTRHSRTLQLTGIAKTAHIGVADKPRRAQAWVGNTVRTPRRAVCWVGDANNKPRRCI